MRAHLRVTHAWTSGAKGGRPSKASEAARIASETSFSKVTTSPVACQTFYRSNLFRYFVVKPVRDTRLASTVANLGDNAANSIPLTLEDQITLQLAQKLDATEPSQCDVGALKQAHIGVALLNGTKEDLTKISEHMRNSRMKDVYEKQVGVMKRFNQPTPPVSILIAHLYPPGPSNPQYEKAMIREAEKKGITIPNATTDASKENGVETVTSPAAQALIDHGRHYTQVSLWLDTTQWTRYTQGHDLHEAARLIRLPDSYRSVGSTSTQTVDPVDHHLLVILDSFDRIIEQARTSLKEDRVNVFDQHRVNGFLHRRSAHRPLLHKLKDGTYKTYKEVWKQLLCFLYRLVWQQQQPSLHRCLTAGSQACNSATLISCCANAFSGLHLATMAVIML